ncbi:MAG: helix-turn-helix domain-containing protein [Defluviitaleaceae bacterium]|nr:helix-turn-helix domain-containing protein [Defluviitaleaceae bacterium]
MKTNDKVKNELLKSFFKLEGNYTNSDKLEAIENKLKNYLENEDKSDKQVSDVLRLSQILKMDITDSSLFEVSCEIASPIIKRLCDTRITEWNFYDIVIAQAVLTWTKTFEDSVALAKVLLAVLKMQENQEKFYKTEFFACLNVLTRLLRADFKELNHYEEEQRAEELRKAFKEFADIALAICLSKGEELRKFEFVILIREAIYHRDNEAIIENLSLLKETGDTDLYKSMKESVIFYGAYASSEITREQFNMLCGTNIRHYREKAGLSIEELAEFLNISTSQMGALERGKKNLYGFVIARIATKLGISTDDLYFGPDKKNIFDSKEELELAQLLIESRGLKGDWLSSLRSIAKNMQKLKRTTKKQPILLSLLEDDDNEIEDE